MTVRERILANHYLSLEIVTDDPARFRHLIGRVNSGVILDIPPGHVTVEKVIRCIDPTTTIAIGIGFEPPDPGQGAVDFGELAPLLDPGAGHPESWRTKPGLL